MSETTWIGWAWVAYVGWTEVCRGDSYADVWGELRARHCELNARLAVLKEGSVPDFRDAPRQSRK